MPHSKFFSGATLDRGFKQRKNPQLLDEALKNDKIKIVCFRELKAEAIYSDNFPTAVWHTEHKAKDIIKYSSL